MAKLALKKGSTDVSVYLFAQDSSKTTGAGLTGLAYNTGSLTAYYVRPLGSATQITLATQTVTGAHSDGGFVEVDATNMPGVYRLDLPDAVCATGVPSVVVMLKGATNLAPVLLEIQLTDFDLNDATPLVTVNDIVTDAIAAAAVKADAVTKIQNGLATPTNITAGTITTVTNLTNLPAMPADWLTAAGVKADAVTKLQTGLALEATLTAIKGAGWTNETLAAIDALIDAIKAKSDLIPAQPAAVGSAMTLTSAYDKAKDDVLTPLGVVDGIVDAIKAKTDTIPASPAQAGEYTAAIAAIPTTPLLAANYTAPDNASISAIKAKTDTIPASPAVAGEYTASIAAIQADLDNPNQYKADVSALATTTHLQEVEDKVDTVDGVVDAIKLKTDTIPASPAQAGEYTAAIAALQADLDNPNQYKADVSGIPDAILAKVIVGTLTLEQVLKVLAAVEIGITTGGGTETIVYTGIDGTIIRLTGVDENGNRTAVIVTPGA